jgi:RNA-directed DNA polymerase
MSDRRQNNQLRLAFSEENRSEAPKAARRGSESLTAKRRTESPAIEEQVMEEVCERENCLQALKRVKSNKGSPGVDGMKVGELSGHLREHWPAICSASVGNGESVRPLR